MKYVFIVNPVSGQGKGIKEFLDGIKSIGKKLDLDYEIYLTKSVGDGENFARNRAEALNGDEARFYACGGDGTVNEVINGIIGYGNVAAGCVPLGTGNDLVRNFPQAGDFMDIESQIKGVDKKVDLIKYSGVVNGIQQTRYCANMFNIGFDCNVVELAGRLKKKPMISGSMAYLLAVGGVFARKKTIHLKLTEGDELVLDEDVLLCSVCNGSYCGGGIYGAPQAAVDDGVFDINIINDVTRAQFLQLFPKYKKGTHMEEKGIEKVIRVRKCKTLTLETGTKNFFLCADGEITLAEKIHFEIQPGLLNFIVPLRDLEK